MNRRLIVFGAIVGIAILIVAAVLVVRSLAILPPVTLNVLYSTEKEGWLNEVVPMFEATRPQINGKPVKIQLEKMGSREMYQAVLDGTKKPDLMSPASSLQVSLLEDEWAKRSSTPVVQINDPNSCRSTLYTPLVLAMWRDRADILWGPDPSGDTWKKLHDALADPGGWEALGKPAWGSYVRFGHTNPLQSNSGLQTLVLLTYDYFNKVNGLTAADIQGNPGYQKWLLEIERNIPQFGNSTGDYMKEMVAYGPAKYDIVAVYESVAIEQAANAAGRYGELRVYYPPTTSMSDHPFCILRADWVTTEKTQAAQLFRDYLLSKPAQELALKKYGYRPADQSISLDAPNSPFDRLAANGIRIKLPQEVETPSGEVLNALLNFWTFNFQK